MKLSSRSAWLLIFFVLIPTTGLLIGFAIFESVINHGPSWLSPETGLDLFYFLCYLIAAIGAPLSALYFYKRRIRESAALERVENYVQGAVKEKLIHRELKEWEKFFLEEKYKETKNRGYDLDRRAPIFRIQGNLVTLSPVGSEVIKLKEEWSVRGFKINAENFPDIRYKIFAQGEEVAVEFSPFSKWVWDVYKIVGGKREWLMNLGNESFNLVASGLAKVVPRAPYGTHRLEEIKRGDLVCFNNMGTGRTVDVEVEDVKHYKKAEDLLEAEGLENVFPGAKDFTEATRWLNAIENYEKRIYKGGIYALRVKLIK
jgi:ASC-1-like (ASCH) protein